MEAATFAANAPLALRYVPPRELEGIRRMEDPVQRVAAFADASRINALSSIMEAGSGHVGTSFSVLEILSWLHLEVVEGDDVVFSSKGHDAPAAYAVLAGVGKLDFDLLHRLRRLGGLPGHPDIEAVPAVATNTGSLGMGVSKAKGFARAARLQNRRRRVFVVTGDGELQEGQFWESLGQAANEGLGEITAIVDHNKIQSDTWIDQVSDLGDLETKVRAFGWAVARCDGNDVQALGEALGALLDEHPDRPKLLVADTVKGSGATVFEAHDLERSATALYAFHSGAPGPDQYAGALGEIATRLGARLGREVAYEEAQAPRRTQPSAPQKLPFAYGEALADAGEREPRLVALDADLYLDTGLIPFRERHPERFVECGIAEQDMVSQAGALALGGMLPAAHSFACFMTPRANEQIFNNATEATKVLYAGTLVGIVPGGPGHSHQMIRDIALMGCLPGMACLEPATDHEARLCVQWAVFEAPGSVYIRLVSVPWELGFEPWKTERLEPGRGTVVREGTSAMVVCTGPVLLSQAHVAAERLGDVGVVSLPWLRDVDGDWLGEVTGDAPVVVLDNHWHVGGQGDAVRAALGGRPVEVWGIDRLPACGSNEEVLREHRLDADSLVERLRELR
ncbi:MAG TPA: 1-deoxy-D-xylulose-5-phosphate synthase N-terminal domain-containing protein [Solirubrobacteraceae bacterium]|nr:1-deoxy-D-xylulose-5-phosphate synthase N-terminal domain-containing protein [Solirubrobacteraceae bacterium]